MSGLCSCPICSALSNCDCYRNRWFVSLRPLLRNRSGTPAPLAGSWLLADFLFLGPECHSLRTLGQTLHSVVDVSERAGFFCKPAGLDVGILTTADRNSATTSTSYR